MKCLAKVNDYKLECDGTYHYFTGKNIKNVKTGKCWCKNKIEKGVNNGS